MRWALASPESPPHTHTENTNTTEECIEIAAAQASTSILLLLNTLETIN